MHTKILILSTTCVTEYIECHKFFMTKFLEETSDAINKRKLLFVYDLSSTVYEEWMKCILPFISIHSFFKQSYLKHLCATIIYTPNKQIKTILDYAWTMYSPTRPIEMICDESDIHETLSTIWKKHSALF